ncbi:MAG: hypothetical protein ACQEXJ_10435 [Myxococcota bacterium]
MSEPTKMVVLTGADFVLEAMRDLIARCGVEHYTEFPHALGAGPSGGRHLETRAHPGASAVLFTTVPAPDAERILDAVVRHNASTSATEHVRAMLLDVERMV